MASKADKILFMLRKLGRDLRRGKVIYAEAQDVNSAKLTEYYFVMDEAQLRQGYSQNFHFDAQDIPLIPSYIDVDEQRLVYYPISIGQFGLAVFHTYLRARAAASRAHFLRIADWFCDNQTTSAEKGSFWLTEVAKPEYRLFEPWPSAFAQSRAISILLRAYQLTGEARYREIAGHALKIFAIPAAEGGVTSFIEHGPLYEEYPAPFPTVVLDGSIYSLFGLYDFVRAAGDDGDEGRLARELFDDGIAALAAVLPRFDLGYWIRYNLCEADFYPDVDPATATYFRMIVAQLRLLHRMTGNEVFRQTHLKWQAYDRLSNRLRMYRLKYRALRQMGRL